MTAPRSVALVGLGLMGGSLARDLAALEAPPRIVAWSQDARDVDQAVAAGVVDEAAPDAAAAAGGGDIVVYAVPLGAALDLLDPHRAIWRAGAVVTDVVSLKAPLVARARELGVSDRFVGGHPMAGGESSGFGASRAGLFRGARVWLADDTGSPAARDAVCALWRAVEAEPAWIPAREHDRRMVWASHLPQLLSNVLAAAVAAEGLHASDLGPGGQGMTRLAASSPDMWRDLLAASGPDLASALYRAGGVLGEVAAALEAGRLDEVAALMERTRAWRREPPPAGASDDPRRTGSP